MPVQLDLWSISPPVSSRPVGSTNDPDAFGCCSRYRSCSAAEKCLIPGLDYSAHCSYRKNLEAGRIFYGKTLAGSLRTAIVRYALPSALCRMAPGWRLTAWWLISANTGAESPPSSSAPYSFLIWLGFPFRFSPLGPMFPRLCGYRQLLSSVTENPSYGPLFRRAQEAGAGSKPGPKTKEFLSDWLNHAGVPLRDELSAPYLLASIRSDALSYLEELYHDTLAASYDGRIYARSPLAEDGFCPVRTTKERNCAGSLFPMGIPRRKKPAFQPRSWRPRQPDSALQIRGAAPYDLWTF